jgi:hypothetical protein
MNSELEELFLEWEKEEIEYQEYLKVELEKSKKIHYDITNYKTVEAFNIFFIYLYFNIMVYCMRFIIEYVERMNQNKRRFRHKIEKPIYFVDELD